MAAEGSSKEQDFAGSIRIADEVIGTIAVLAAGDVEGVAEVVQSRSGGFRGRFGSGPSAREVKAEVDGEEVSIAMSLIVEYGSRIPELSRQVQKKVSTTISNMTGFTVREVSITIDGIKVPES